MEDSETINALKSLFLPEFAKLTDKVMSLFQSLNCSTHEGELKELRLRIVMLESRVQEGKQQDLECRENTTKIRELEILVKQNSKKDGEQENRFFELCKYFGGIIALILGAILTYKLGTK